MIRPKFIRSGKRCTGRLGPSKIRSNEIQSGSLFLDMGCGLGQDLQRLVHNGAPAEGLIGLD